MPTLIKFPELAIAVFDSNQTEEFFVGTFGQYEGVTVTEAVVEVVAATSHSIWADVTWDRHGEALNERNMYQLVRTGDDWKIAVSTPLDDRTVNRQSKFRRVSDGHFEQDGQRLHWQASYLHSYRGAHRSCGQNVFTDNKAGQDV